MKRIATTRITGVTTLLATLLALPGPVRWTAPDAVVARALARKRGRRS